MKIYKTLYFTRWMKKEHLTDTVLSKAMTELVSGLHDGNLGGDLYKKRIARTGQGKHGAYRTIIACRYEDNAFFVYGYSKNRQSTLDPDEFLIYKYWRNNYLNLIRKQLILR